MISWLRRAWTKHVGDRYLARRQRDARADQRLADELQQARDGTTPRPGAGF
jgi:hypothetical protein